MFGQMPCSRWGHVAVGSANYENSPHSYNDGYELKDSLFIFGGISLNSYCRSKLYQFKFENNLLLTSKETELRAQEN
jgi:hypothetical protein